MLKALIEMVTGDVMIDIAEMFGCNDKPPMESIAWIDMSLMTGFGMSSITHNGREVVDGERPLRSKKDRSQLREWTLRDVEKLARRDPRGVWQLRMEGSLRGAVWERRRPG